MGKHVSQRGYSITGNVIYVDISRINGLIALAIVIVFLRKAIPLLKSYLDRKRAELGP
jgi:hypothetical protein